MSLWHSVQAFGEQFESDRGRGREHRVGAAVHVGEAGFRHVAVDAIAAWSTHLVTGTGLGVGNAFLMTRLAGAVRVLGSKAVSIEEH